MAAAGVASLSPDGAKPPADAGDIEQLLKDGTPAGIRNADNLLAELGSRNGYLMLTTLVLSLGWAVGAMPIMCSAFIVDAGECEDAGGCTDSNRSTIASEFNLVGNRRYLADWTTSAFMMGNMVGASALTHISDRIGRRPVLIFSLLTMGVTGCASMFADSIHALTICRFLQGICLPGICLVVWVLGYECSPICLRGYATLIFGVMWVVGYCALAPLAYFLTSWRLLLLVSTAPAAVLAVIYFFIIPESLHFLVVNGKKTEARRWIRTAAKYSKLDCQAKMTSALEEVISANEKRDNGCEKSKSFLVDHLLANKIYILYMSILTFLWTSDTFVYFGLSLFSARFAGNRYWNYALSGLVELPAYLFAPPMLDYMGRKPVVAGTHFLAGFALIALIFLPAGTAWLSTPCWLLGKFAISCSFMCIFVYGSEIFPTTIRNVSIGLCSLIARVGGIVAPYVRLLEPLAAQLPMVFFGTVAVAAGLFTLMLPETRNRVLPSSLDDVPVKNTK